MKRLFVFALLLACTFGIAFAQEMTSGTLEGVVSTENGSGVKDAVVTVIGPQGAQTTSTDGKGRYVMRGLVPGDYQVKAEAIGLTTVVQSGVKVFINRRTQLPFTLSTGVTETITVVSRAPIVDLKSTTTGETINISDFAPYLPVGRNLTSIVGIAPGVSDGGTIGAQNQSISGSSGLENAYFVDGVNVTNSGFGALGSYSIVYGSLGSGVTYDFLEEVQVKTGGFEAEFGQAGGGVVNSVVRSGSNKFGFDISWYEEPASFEGGRGDRIDFPNWANRTETTRQDIALSAGGPIIKDKLFYFAAYNPVTVEEDFKLTSGDGDEVYDLDGDGTDYTFGIGETVTGGRVPSSVTRERSIDNYAAKLAWFIVPNHKVELTAFGDPSDGEVGPQDPNKFLRNLADPAGVPDPTAGAVGLDYGGDQLSLKYQAIWTSNFFTEVLLASKENNFTETGPGTTFRSFFDVAANTVTGGSGFYEDKLDETTQWSIKNTHVFGPVEVRYGYQFEDMEFRDPSFRSGPSYTSYFPRFEDDVNIDTDGNGVADDTGIGLLGDGSLGSSYTALQSTTGAAVDIIACDIDGDGDPDEECYNVTRTAFEPLDSKTTNEETNIFAQVSWDVLPNLTVKAGARWTEQELQGSGMFDMPFSTLDGGSVTGVGTTSFAPKTYKFDSELAPRLGVSWDVINNGKHKLYANYGEYYQRVPSDLAVRQFSNEVGIEGEQFLEGDLDTPFNNGDCWIDSDSNGIYDTEVPCHIADGVTGAEPGVILDGTQDPHGDPIVGNNAPTKLPFTKEWLGGYAWEINDYTSLEVRYINRELGRVLEDVQFASNEQIWNEFYGTDGVVRDSFTDPFPGHGVGSFGAYVLANPGDNVDANLFPIPARDYRAWEFVYNRRFHDGWMAYLNYRYGKLDGNYEGSFRNDNGQSDPFITSLFDIPAASYAGDLNDNGMVDADDFLESETLKGQYVLGPLNTDRTHIFNAFVSKQYDMGLNLGGRVTVRSGQPQFPLFAHPTYRNSGEIPGVNPEYWWQVSVDNDALNDATALSTGCDPKDDTWCEDGIPNNDPMGYGIYSDEDATLGTMPDQDYDGDGEVDAALGIATGPRLFSYDAVARDHFGRNPTTVTFDMHASYDFDLRDGKSKLTLMLDVFNLFNDNDSLTFDTALETRPGAVNPDYLKANLYQAPRNVRFGAKFSW